MSKLSSRRAMADDAERILSVGVARDVEDLGAPDWTLADGREEMAEAVHVWVAEEDGCRPGRQREAAPVSAGVVRGKAAA